MGLPFLEPTPTPNLLLMGQKPLPENWDREALRAKMFPPGFPDGWHCVCNASDVADGRAANGHMGCMRRHKLLRQEGEKRVSARKGEGRTYRFASFWAFFSTNRGFGTASILMFADMTTVPGPRRGRSGRVKSISALGTYMVAFRGQDGKAGACRATKSN